MFRRRFLWLAVVVTSAATQDPRHNGNTSELKDKAIVPDVLLQPHYASLEITFYEAPNFRGIMRRYLSPPNTAHGTAPSAPAYEADPASPMHQTGRASGEYEDFVTGFVVDNGTSGDARRHHRGPGWLVARHDDGSNSIWRVSYTGRQHAKKCSELNHAANRKERVN